MPKCPYCTAAGVDHEQKKAEILASPLMTGIAICGFNWFKDGILHKDLDTWFLKGMDLGYRRFMLMLPRDHLKTSYLIAYMVNQILNDPEVRILYRMSSASNAEKTLESIINILGPSNAVLAHFFPHAVLNPTDRETRITASRIRCKRRGIYREGTIEARGIDSKVTGGHYTHIIFDDLIDEKMIDSEQTQDVAINRLKRSDPLFVEPDKNVEIVVGTRWPGMFYQWLIEDSGITDEYWSMLLGCYKDARYVQFLRAIDKEEEFSDDDKMPVWPEHFTRETLEKIERKSPYDFLHQWLNLAVDEGGRRFKKEDFNHYWIDYGDRLNSESCNVKLTNGGEYKVNVSSLYRTITIDPATGEHGKTDQSAITVCGFDRKTGMIFLLDAIQGRWLPDETIEHIIGCIRRWKPHVVAPEAVAFQHTFKHFLKQEMSRQDVHARIQPVKPGHVGKGRRILDALQPFIAAGQLYVLREHDRTVVDELCSLQVVGGKVVGRSPNLADALSYNAEFWRGLELNQIDIDDDTDDVPDALEECIPAYNLQVLT